MTDLIIRTHDRLKFKDCRQAWDFGSKIRQNYEPQRVSVHLWFGTCVHAGLEAYYEPLTWGHREMQEASAITAFAEAMEGFKPDRNSTELMAEWNERYDLGIGMLNNYFVWAPKQDEGGKPLAVELEFEVDIPSPDYMLDVPMGKGFNDELLFQGSKVLYQGRVDMLWQDKYEGIWIVDHKTAGKWDDTAHLDMDEQTGSYCWAIQQQLGIKIQGVIYNELLKGVPDYPKVLKSGKLSQDKQQNTTYELYKEALDKAGQSEVGYDDHLRWLQDNERQYFRRTAVHRSQRELQLLGERIGLEAIDMLDSPSIYPSPNRFKCGNCEFRSPCLMAMDGSDVELFLTTNYNKRA